MHKIPVGVLGASGYAGRELCALVAGHPRLELAFAAARERRGERLRVAGRDVIFVGADEAPLGDAALVFSALPHGASAEWVGHARAAGAKVVDLSADLRPGNGAAHGAGKGSAGALDAGAPYGLPELTREAVRLASVVANPGCYPTATLLALLPLLARDLLAPDATIAVNAASGVTGAGFTPRHDLLFAEVSEDYRAYGVGNGHHHLAEMRAVLAGFGGAAASADLVFTPHLLPVARGILATIVVPVREAIADPAALWARHYAGEPFVEIADAPPSLREVVRRNVARIHVTTVRDTQRPTLLILAAIDNLVKGAAGQAVQNANLLLGIDETAGLLAGVR
jgi:N-acetyl-gamma-glutamyl-phosphate reductase